MIITRVLEQSDRHRLIEGLTDDGEPFRAYECQIDPDNPAMWEDMFDDYVADLERDLFLKTHDPNEVDSRRVRRELGDDFVNLGRRANRVPDKIWRL